MSETDIKLQTSPANDVVSAGHRCVVVHSLTYCSLGKSLEVQGSFSEKL